MTTTQPLNTGKHKYCKACDSMKHIKQFSNRAASKDGLHVRCKKCDSDYYKAKEKRIPRGPMVSRKTHDAIKQSNNEMRCKVKAQQKRINELKDQVMQLQGELIKCQNNC